MRFPNREVRFDLYCDKCVHKLKPGTEEPCDSCLEQFYNVDTDKPIKYEEREHGAYRDHKRKASKGG